MIVSDQKSVDFRPASPKTTVAQSTLAPSRSHSHELAFYYYSVWPRWSTASLYCFLKYRFPETHNQQPIFLPWVEWAALFVVCGASRQSIQNQDDHFPHGPQNLPPTYTLSCSAGGVVMISKRRWLLYYASTFRTYY